MSCPISISGVGLCTSIGGYEDACAAYRAGLNRFAGHVDYKSMIPGDEEPTPLTVAPAAVNVEGFKGVGRTVKMLAQAYTDLLSRSKLKIPENTLILLALPDPLDREFEVDILPNAPREERLQKYLDSITGPLFELTDPNLNTLPFQAVFGDRVAFARVLKKATEYIRNGSYQHCLLMAVDSLLNDEDLEAQLELNLLKTGDNPVGYIPGEGAGMFLISNCPEDSAGLNLTISSEIDNEILVDEAGDESGVISTKLSDLISRILPGSDHEKLFPQQFLDINGTEDRAKIYGFLEVKIRSKYPNAIHYSPHVPALSFGEVGVMMGAICFSIIAASVQRGYATSDEFLITLSEEDGRCAAIKLNF